MSTFDKFKQKIKQVNLPGKLTQMINEGGNPSNPYLQEQLSQIKPVEEPD
jgi:hypothetical protein